ncbi:hypothetical protein DPMN_137159 [Dreissena polymorpha]|uniref:Uncharacterized protein n=1 Tax=Dreissena polymorpha TaxID=45954 RepID=A0A9D4G587_DREPO|nr:hypothetical protein DPMN_137159 [Dreissena polymorpha]
MGIMPYATIISIAQPACTSLNAKDGGNNDDGSIVVIKEHDGRGGVFVNVAVAEDDSDVLQLMMVLVKKIWIRITRDPLALRDSPNTLRK